MKLSGIFLCAGLSTRMGRQKLLLPFGGATVVEIALEQVLASDLDEVVIVTGKDSRVESIIRDVIEASSSHLAVKIVRNPSSEKGQASSLKLGMENTSLDSDGFIFFLGDMPLVNRSLTAKLINFFKEDPGYFAIPVCKGKRGNPTIFPSKFRAELLEQKGDYGGRMLLKNHESQIRFYETEEDVFLGDVDTEDDFKKLTSKSDSLFTSRLRERLTPGRRSENENTVCITLSGGGGKTTSMIYLSRFFGSRVRTLMTTTTKVLSPELQDYSTDYIVRKSDTGDLRRNDLNDREKNPVLLLGESVAGGKKYSGPDPEELEGIYHSGMFDVIAIESDGSDCRPVKVHGWNEPVIPDYADVCVSLLGMSALNRTTDSDTIHRFPAFLELFPNHNPVMDTEQLIEVINHPKGLFNKAPLNSLRVLWCNQWDLIPEDERSNVRRKFKNGIKSADLLVLSILKDGGRIVEVIEFMGADK